MARVTLNQKADRVLKLLLGLRIPRIAAALSARGFTEKDLDEGWTLLRGVSRVQLSQRPAPPRDPSALARLDAWENQWFPIIDATLRRRFPTLHASVFLNLSQTDGPAVVVTVTTLIERIESLDGSKEGKDARKLLETRGLTTETLGEAKALLAKLASVQPAPTDEVDLAAQKEALAKAEVDLWAWYLEWAQIARASITDRTLLRQLGFLGRRSRVEDDAAPDEPAEDLQDEAIA